MQHRLNQTNNQASPVKTPIKANSRIITSEDIDRMGYKNAQEVLANQARIHQQRYLYG